MKQLCKECTYGIIKNDMVLCGRFSLFTPKKIDREVACYYYIRK